MENKNPQIIDRLSQDFQGAIWIGNSPLNENIPGFKELNYIFDGLISQAIHSYSKEQMSTPLSFFTKSFGEDFFLYYFINNVELPISLPKNRIENKNKVLIINASLEGKIQTEKIEKSFPAFQFELLEFPKQ
jgi:hypothetical protein